jgi:hypothetical protein
MTQAFQADQDIESRAVERPTLRPDVNVLLRSSFEKFQMGGRVRVLVGNPGFLCGAPLIPSSAKATASPALCRRRCCKKSQSAKVKERFCAERVAENFAESKRFESSGYLCLRIAVCPEGKRVFADLGRALPSVQRFRFRAVVVIVFDRLYLHRRR